MWQDDYHDNYVHPENEEELDELLNAVSIYLTAKNRGMWQKMCEDIRKCAEIFGYINISVYSKENSLELGGRVEEFLRGFWINLRDGEYNEGKSIYFENADIMIDNGFMFVQH